MTRAERSRFARPFVAIAILAALAAGTGHAEEDAATVTPPMAVGVVRMKARDIPVVSELPGRIAATRTAEVRAQVSGIVRERVFTQGSLVRQGDVLFRIDPRLFEVRVHSAEAGLQRVKAAETNTRLQLDRRRALRERNVSTGADFDAAAANLAQAEADVALAEAALEEARIHLDHTEIRAPITGVIGAALVTEGSLVSADGTSSLALIQRIDPVYADVTQSAEDLARLKRAVRAGRLEGREPGAAKVELLFDGGENYPERGTLLFSNAAVDPGTGQVTLRAEFPNPRGELLPGLYVRVRIEQGVQVAALTVPQRAIARTAAGKPQVFVLDAAGKAEARDVDLGSAIGSDWLVVSGLRDGETVIAEGLQKVRPGGTYVAEPSASAEIRQASDRAAN